MKGSGFCQAPHGEERRTRAASDPELIPYCTGNRNSISVESCTWSDIWQEMGRYPCGVFPRTLLENACLFWKLAVSANNKTHYTIFTFSCPRRFTGRSWKTAAWAEQFSYIKNFCWKLNRHQITLLDPVLAVTSADSAALAVDTFMCVACFNGRYNPKQTPQKTKTNLPLYVWLILNDLAQFRCPRSSTFATFLFLYLLPSAAWRIASARTHAKKSVVIVFKRIWIYSPGVSSVFLCAWYGV